MASRMNLAPSIEKVNFARIISLLIDGGQLALCHQFDQHFPPSCLANGLRKAEIRKTLVDLRGKGKLNDMQWKRLYPPMKGPPVSSENFDISLLLCLLRNICGLKPPKTGWDNPPSPRDVSTVADIVRIRLLQNELQHLPAASMADQDFQTKWHEMESILTRLGSGIPHFTDSIRKLKYDSWDPDKRKEDEDAILKKKDSDKVVIDRIDDTDLRTSIIENKK
ncbi:hypothetical protein CHS0354_017056 [Potamilus streckersoni]|uniref:DZIP3-like HEPN domain-containing protein n=1 Tax=Potamilus streckersoni TaxID=2493646 RepID=A0AAE0S6Y2_9BIVA|nr:hypothetical protein CHS0354_017056 [Potamilus streckersoni]